MPLGLLEISACSGVSFPFSFPTWKAVAGHSCQSGCSLSQRIYFVARDLSTVFYSQGTSHLKSNFLSLPLAPEHPPFKGSFWWSKAQVSSYSWSLNANGWLREW